jgi:hypothetical protein
MAPLTFPSLVGPSRLRGRQRPTVFVLVLIALAVLVHPATVGATGWCRADPVFKIEDQILHVDVASDPLIFASTTGPIKVKIKVPQGTRVGTIALDPGFGLGYDIDIIKVSTWDDPGPDDPTRVDVLVLVPNSGDRLPVQVTVYEDPALPKSTEGLTRDWIRVRTHV